MNNTLGFNLADEKMKLIDIHLEDDDFLAPPSFSQDSFPEEQNLLRRSLAWDSAFFNSAGVLDPDELSFINKGFRKAESHLFSGSNDVRDRISESESTPMGHDLSADWFAVESSVYNPVFCNASNVFDKSPEPGLGQKGVQDVQALKKVDESSRSKMKSYRASIGRSVPSDGKTKKEPTPRRRHGMTPSPLPQKAIGSATNISSKLNNKENIFGKSCLKMDKRSSTSCSVSSVAHSINKSIPASSAQASSFSKRETDSGSLPTSKIWRYSGRNKGIGNDIDASTRSLSLSSSKRIPIESKDAKEASALKGIFRSTVSSAYSSRASSGTRLSAQTLRPSGLRPPSPRTRFSLENSAPSYHGETRTRKLPQNVASKGTTFGHASACKKVNTPCSDVPKNTKRPKIESSNTPRVMKEGKCVDTGRVVDQENGMKKPSYSFDRLENLSRYFEAIDLNQEKRVNRPSRHNKIDVGNRGMPVFPLLKQENQLLNSSSVRAATSIPSMRTPLSDKTFSCNFSGKSMEPKREKLAKKASSVYATSKVLNKENN